MTPELVCSLPILTTFGWNGGSRVDARLPGLRQGTTVCVHASVDMEQQSHHKLITPSGMGVLCLWGRVAPLLSPWCARGNMPTGVNLNQYAGPRSCIRWRSENESLSGQPNQPKLIVCMSLGHSVEFQVRRASWDVPSSITLDHGDLVAMGGPAQLEYARRTGLSLGHTTRCVLSTSRAWVGVWSSHRVCKV